MQEGHVDLPFSIVRMPKVMREGYVEYSLTVLHAKGDMGRRKLTSVDNCAG